MHIGDEFESWLEQDVAGHIDHMIRLSLGAERRERLATPSNILVRSRGCAWPIAHPVTEVTPAQLREVADEHDRLAETLLRDAAELRDYADALEQPTELGSAMHEHFGTMRDEKAHKASAEVEAMRIATGGGGVLGWEAVDNPTRWNLYHAGYLRIDDVRDALESRALRKVDGIGPVRFTKIAVALAEAVDA